MVFSTRAGLSFCNHSFLPLLISFARNKQKLLMAWREKQPGCWKREARSIYYLQYKPLVELNFCHWLISNCMMTRVRLMNDMWYTDCSARLESWTFPLRKYIYRHGRLILQPYYTSQHLFETVTTPPPRVSRSIFLLWSLIPFSAAMHKESLLGLLWK